MALERNDSLDITLHSHLSSSLATPKQSLTKEYGDCFKLPSSSFAARALDFEFDGNAVAIETSAQRMTRQRTNLKGVTIEELTANFEPPDLMPDMFYNDGDEDYEAFLADCFYKYVVY